jgi:non-specific serine/threonine protein kinase/serine/threonine-protein kinase
MSAPAWARVKTVLEKALSVSLPERESAIADACAGDEALRLEVEDYLRYEDAAPSLLPATQWRTSLPINGPQEPPERVGPWKILREIGHGGMGVVYLAERDDGEYRQTAALKLIRDSHHSEAFVDLFRRERQTLAQLNHPNIARMLDGGTTPAGLPYFAMEYVEGTTLSEYCQRRDLGLEEKLHLFLQICRAVSHAHRNLFIHRDLKPGNIIVTAEGEPKLLDFGLAKLLEAGTDHKITVSAMPLFTPAYASPEQMRGEPLTTASDVYSLGVILYELLAQRSPYKAQGQSFAELWTAVCMQMPEPPSAAIEQAARRYRDAADLDSIVLMALRKEPEQRYPSADALSDDLELYLARMPVRARRGNAAYHVRRFVVRHKWAVMAAVAPFIGACVLFGVILWEEQQTALRFQQLRRFANSVVFELHDSIESLPGSTPARKLLVQRSLEYLRSLEASSGRDLGLKWELAEAYKRIGDAQGNPGVANLGDLRGALDSYGRARSLLLQITAAGGENQRTLKTLAQIDSSSALILELLGKSGEARTLRQEAVDLLRKLALSAPTPAAHKALALSHYNLALNLNELGNWPAAQMEWQATLAQYKEIANSTPGDLGMQRNVALSEKRLAAAYLRQNDFLRAIEHDRAAERIDRARLDVEPVSTEAKMDLSFDLSDLGLALSGAQHFNEAVVSYQGALALRREVLAADPSDHRAQTGVGRLLDRLSDAESSAGHIDSAIETGREATKTLAAVQLHDPSNQTMVKEAALAFAHLGRQYRTRASSLPKARAATDWRAALAAFEQAARLLEGLDDTARLTPREHETIQTVPGSLATCRQMLTSRLGR